MFTQEDYKKIEKYLQSKAQKDSEFNDAETPLDGTELVTLVQNGFNKKLFIKDFVDQLFNLGVSDFLNVTDKYDSYYISLEEAIKLIPYKSRKVGQVITFINKEGNWQIYQFKGVLNQWNHIELWEDLLNLVIDSTLPDEEDLTKSLPDENGNSYLSLKDREYNSEDFSGLGRIILRKNILDIEDPIYGKVKKNVLYQDMFTQSNTVYEIRYDFDLNNQTITIPENCILKYEGGSLNNGHIVYQNTKIQGIESLNNITTEGLFAVIDAVTDEEDLHNNNGVLKFADREYNPNVFSGLGKIILRKNIVNGKNILTQDMIDKENTIYEIRYDFNLFDKEINIPEGCMLKFEGGSLSNGTINYNNTIIEGYERLNMINITGEYIRLRDIDPDEEDITKEGGVLKFKNRDTSRGMGYIILRKDKSFAEQVTKENTIYEIRYDFTLDENITIPANCMLKFNGGSLSSGSIIGEVYTTNGFIDAESFGIKYNDVDASLQNTQCFEVIKRITNRLPIRLNGDIHLSGGPFYGLENLIIDGNGHSIILHDFKGFYVSKDIDIVSTKFTSPSVLSTFAFLNDDEYTTNVNIERCVLSGVLRFIRCLKRDANNTDKDAIISFNVVNNRFENLFSGHSIPVFDFQNTNVIYATIKNNYGHNFYTTLFDFSVSNGTVYGTTIPQYYKNKGRNFIFNNNTFINDIDFKPWSKADYKPYYFAVSVIEFGNVVISDSVFKNIIDNTDGDDASAVYDNYLNVDIVEYKNNRWENCVNIKNPNSNDIKNQFIKAKGSGNKREYVGNTYIYSNLAELFDGLTDTDVLNAAPYLTSIMGTWENFIFDSNTINAYAYNGILFTDFRVKYQAIINNTVTIEKIKPDSGIYAGIFNASSLDNAITNFENNIVNIADNSNRSIYPIAIPSNVYQESTQRYINVYNNYLRNCGLVGLKLDLGSSNTCVNASGNTLLWYSTYNTLVWSTKKEKVNLDNNIIVFGNGGYFKLFSNVYYNNTTLFKNISSSTIHIEMEPTLGNDGNYIAIYSKFFNEKSEVQSELQVNFDKENNKSKCVNSSLAQVEVSGSNKELLYLSPSNSYLTLRAYATYVDYAIANTNSDFIHIKSQFFVVSNIDDFSIMPKIANSSQISSFVCKSGVEIFDSSYKIYRRYDGTKWRNMVGKTSPQSAITSDPLEYEDTQVDRGASIFNTTRQKPIWWNGSKWLNSDGAKSSVSYSGTFADKPEAADIYVGFKYFCTDKQTVEGAANGIEIIHKGNNVWVDALGRVVS